MAAFNPSFLLLDLENQYLEFEKIFHPRLFCRFADKVHFLHQISSRTNIRVLHLFIPKSEHGQVGTGIVVLNSVYYIYCIDQASIDEMNQRYNIPLLVKVIHADSLLPLLRGAILLHNLEQSERRRHEPDEYNDALQQGHGAYLLEQDEKSQDNFIINVGALPPSKECTITISYVTQLEFIQGSTIRFVVPTTIAPRYNPDKSGISGVAGTTSKYIQYKNSFDYF